MMTPEDYDYLYNLKLILHRLEIIELGYGEIMQQTVRLQMREIYANPFYNNGDDE